MTQKMRLKGTEIEFKIQDEVYPYVEAGIFYLRVVLLNYDGEPAEFLSIMPQDILYRAQPYTEEKMQEIKIAANAVNNQAIETFKNRIAEEKKSAETDDDSMYHG